MNLSQNKEAIEKKEGNLDQGEDENKDLETQVHEACRTGNAEDLKLLLDADPEVASKLNTKDKSALSLACSHGHLDMVKLLLNEPGMLGSGKDGFGQTYIHVAVSGGQIDVVKELLGVCPDLARMVDENGNSPLHYAASKGHREITWMLLRLDPKLAEQHNNNGHTPLHLAAINYKVSVLQMFVSMAKPSFQIVTKAGEMVFHLAVRYGRYDALVYLTHVCNDIEFFDCRDIYGNTILHLAVSIKLRKIFLLATYISLIVMLVCTTKPKSNWEETWIARLFEIITFKGLYMCIDKELITTTKACNEQLEHHYAYTILIPRIPATTHYAHEAIITTHMGDEV